MRFLEHRQSCQRRQRREQEEVDEGPETLVKHSGRRFHQQQKQGHSAAQDQRQEQDVERPRVVRDEEIDLPREDVI